MKTLLTLLALMLIIAAPAHAQERSDATQKIVDISLPAVEVQPTEEPAAQAAAAPVTEPAAPSQEPAPVYEPVAPPPMVIVVPATYRQPARTAATPTLAATPIETSNSAMYVAGTGLLLGTNSQVYGDEATLGSAQASLLFVLAAGLCLCGMLLAQHQSMQRMRSFFGYVIAPPRSA